MVPINLDDTQTSRSRIYAKGKTLFARLGYENVSALTIAKEAGTSESQLIRYFGGKAGLLEAIFNDSWRPLNDKLQSVIGDATNAYEAILAVLSTILTGFSEDPELAVLFLFEGRRIRGSENNILLSQGFLQFADMVQRLIRRGQKDGSLSAELNDGAVASALIGSAEGMIRERLIAQKSARPDPFSEDDVRRIFSALLDGLR